MSNLIPTPYRAGWRHAMVSAATDRDTYNPPAAFKTEYDQGWGDALSAWDIDHGAEMIPESEMTEAQRASLARQRAVLGPDWPKGAGS